MASRHFNQSESLKVLYLSIYANENYYSEHQVAQINSWIGGIDNIYWLRGVGSDSPITVDGHFIDLPVEEKFGNILEKRILGLRYALDKFNCDFFALMNTSTYVNPIKIQQLLASADKNKSLAFAAKGSHLSVRSGYVEEFLAGNLIILSKSAAESLTELESEEWVGIADDIAISEFLKRKRAEFKFIARNDLTDFYPFVFKAQHRIKSWQDPQITVSRFYEIQAIYSKKGNEFLKSYFRHYFNEFKRFIASHPPLTGINLLRILKFVVSQLAATAQNSAAICQKLL